MEYSVSATKSKKKKLFPCFRTAAASSAASFRDKYAQHDHVFPSTPVKGGRNGGGGGGRSLSRALKAVLFRTSLAKKIRERKVKQKQNSNQENPMHQDPSATSSRSRIDSDLHYRKSFGRSSPVSAPFSSSSFCTSPPSSEISDVPSRFRSTAANRLFRQIKRLKSYSGWFLILVCLQSLILWGKIGAILCTSILILCFCLLRRVIGFRSPDYKAGATEMRSGETGRRTVSDGFRNCDLSAARNSIFRVD